MDHSPQSAPRMVLRPRRIGEILTDAFELYRLHFATLIAISAIIVVPLTVAEHFLGARLASQVVVVEGGEEVRLTPAFWRVLAGSLALAVLGFIITQLLAGAIARAAAGGVLGQRPTVAASYAVARDRLGAILVASILSGLAVLGGLILFIIPGLVIFTRLALPIPGVVIERLGGRASLSRSWNLVRGHGWHVFGAVISAAILVGLLDAAATAPFRGGWLSQTLASSVVSSVALPYSTVVVVLVYLDLRVRDEGLDGETLESELRPAG